MGPREWNAIVEEGSWPGIPMKWCYLFNCWVAAKCRTTTQVWEDLQWILTGELFVKQVWSFEWQSWLKWILLLKLTNHNRLRKKIIPASKELHLPSEYKALFLIDNSQGHSAYSADALLVSCMNLGPGGAKPCMQDGWYMWNGQKITRSMVFPQDHSTNPGQPKGVREVLREWGLWWNGLLLLCQNSKCSVDATSCCATHIMSLQPDFQAQWSLVQETIEAAGHLCIFLPKFHCELNFIEFFWGAVKKYLREHCNYSYSGLS